MDRLDFLTPADFYRETHREIFQRMRELWDTGSSIGIELIADRDPELARVCIDAQVAGVSVLYVPDYARRVKALAQKRRYVQVANTLVGYAVNGKTPEDIADYLMAEVEAQTAAGSTNPFDRWQEQGITAAEAAAAGKIERCYLVQDLIREKSLTIFFGPPGEFKSALLMDLALCIANGTSWLQRLPIAGNDQPVFAIRPARVLWLNYDQGHDDVIERLGAMTRVYGGGENVTAISHSSPPAILEHERQARSLGAYCARHGYGVVFVDSLLDVKGKADLQEAGMGDVLRLWRLVAEVGGCAIIIVSHSTKLTADLYGSQFIKAKLDHLYRVSRLPGTDVAVIESEKQRNFGETGKLYARWTYTHFAGTRTLETARFLGDGTEKRTAHPNTTTQVAILNILMASPGRGFGAADLSSLLNEDRDEDELISLDATRKAANRLVENEHNVGKTKALYHYGELVSG
jgi:hypothetical protein